MDHIASWRNQKELENVFRWKEYTFEQASSRRQKQDCSISWQMIRIPQIQHTVLRHSNTRPGGSKVGALGEGPLDV